MRKLSYALFFVILLNISASAQSDVAFASVHYTLKHVMDTTQPNNPITREMVLLLGKNLSNYTTLDKVDNIRKTGVALRTGPGVTVSPAEIAAYNANGNYYKNTKDGKLTYMLNTSGKLFGIQETVPVIDWKISDETKEIMGLKCQKATGDFKGRTYEAWFCSALPYNNGPWKLGGLPGLIIEAADTKKEVVFSFVSFENEPEKPLTIEILKEASTVTPKEYKQYTDALERDAKAMSGASAAVGDRVMVVGSSSTRLGPDGKPIKPRQMNNPIEKETKP